MGLLCAFNDLALNGAIPVSVLGVLFDLGLGFRVFMAPDPRALFILPTHMLAIHFCIQRCCNLSDGLQDAVLVEVN